MPHAFRPAIRSLASIGILLLPACGTPRPVAGPAPDTSASFAIYDVEGRGYIDVGGLVEALGPADVVFFGEYHDDEVAHRLELEVLRGLGELRTDLLLGLEMFERDVQPVIEAYRTGEIDEERFLEEARPWGNYGTDYRPMVELAKARGWEVRGTNLPQSLATAIARGGLAALESVSATDRAFAARENDCPTGPYWDRFIDAMTENADSAGHAAITPDDPMFRSMFEAQCARDEAMAESLAEAWSAGRLIYHVNGAFHTDYRLGIVPRLLRRRPGLDVRVISAVQVEDVRRPSLDDHLDRADFLIFTPDPAL